MPSLLNGSSESHRHIMNRFPDISWYLIVDEVVNKARLISEVTLCLRCLLSIYCMNSSIANAIPKANAKAMVVLRCGARLL